MTVQADKVDAPDVDGTLAVGEGLDIDIDGDLEGTLEVRLAMPAEPDEPAVPVVIYRTDDVLHLHAGLWDATTEEVVVSVDEVAVRWPSWVAVDDWWEAIRPGPGGAAGPAVDAFTARTEPPECGDDSPSWAPPAPSADVDSVHVCQRASTADDGTIRAEVLVTSNRDTAQLITPPTDIEDQWAQDQPEALRATLAEGVGASEGDVLLLGGSSTSWTHRQPETTTTAGIRAYQSPIVGVLNQALVMLGAVGGDDALAVAASAWPCTSDAAGANAALNDVVADRGSELALEVVPCILGQLTDVEQALDVFDQQLADRGMPDTHRTDLAGRLQGSVERMAGLVAALSAALEVVGEDPAAWDVVTDDLVDSSVSFDLTGSEDPPADLAEPHQQPPAAEPTTADPEQFRYLTWAEGQPLSYTPGTIAFTTLSGNITCCWGAAGARLVCHVRERSSYPPEPVPGCGEISWVDTYVGTVEDRGLVDGLCTGGVEVTFAANTIDYGTRVADGDFSCTVEESGVSCTRLSTGQAFTVNRAGFHPA